MIIAPVPAPSNPTAAVAALSGGPAAPALTGPAAGSAGSAAQPSHPDAWGRHWMATLTYAYDRTEFGRTERRTDTYNLNNRAGVDPFSPDFRAVYTRLGSTSVEDAVKAAAALSGERGAIVGVLQADDGAFYAAPLEFRGIHDVDGETIAVDSGRGNPRRNPARFDLLDSPLRADARVSHLEFTLRAETSTPAGRALRALVTPTSHTAFPGPA